jgi:hypothetical protein
MCDAPHVRFGYYYIYTTNPAHAYLDVPSRKRKGRLHIPLSAHAHQTLTNATCTLNAFYFKVTELTPSIPPMSHTQHLCK